MTARQPVGGAERVALVLVVVAAAVLLGLWAVLVPPFQAPDEKAHFDSALHLALGDPWVAPGSQHVLAAVQAAAAEAPIGTTTCAKLPAINRPRSGSPISAVTNAAR